MKADMGKSLGLLFADAGLPMIVFTFPTMVVLLIPIIVIEGFLCRKWLGWTTWEALKANAFSNLVSAIIRVPVAWAIMLGVELVSASTVGQTRAIQESTSPLLSAIVFLLSS